MKAKLLHSFVRTGLLLANAKTQSNFELPNDIRDVCPYTRFCNMTANIEQVPDGATPCCEPCSCDIDCGKNRNCCWYEIDWYRLDEKNVSSCIQPAVNARGIEIQDFSWYHMIDKCLDGSSCRNHHSESTTSGMFPHSDPVDGFIYVSKACAECNNVTDVLPWRFSFVCRGGMAGSNSISVGVENVLNANKDDIGCDLLYLPPASVDVSVFKCYPEGLMVRECHAEHLSHELSLDLNEKCQSFNATFRVVSASHSAVFANIYCAMCQKKKHIATHDFCNEESEIFKSPKDSVLLLFDSKEHKESDLIPGKLEFCQNVSIFTFIS